MRTHTKYQFFPLAGYDLIFRFTLISRDSINEERHGYKWIERACNCSLMEWTKEKKVSNFLFDMKPSHKVSKTVNCVCLAFMCEHIAKRVWIRKIMCSVWIAPHKMSMREPKYMKKKEITKRINNDHICIRNVICKQSIKEEKKKHTNETKKRSVCMVACVVMLCTVSVSFFFHKNLMHGKTLHSQTEFGVCVCVFFFVGCHNRWAHRNQQHTMTYL